MTDTNATARNGGSFGPAIRAAYRAGQEDEALEPIIRADEFGRPVGRIGSGDAVIFYDIRGEREIEITAFYVEKVEEMCEALGAGEVVTVLGRYWPLDREENWDRVEKAYRALVYGEGTPAGNFSDRNS